MAFDPDVFLSETKEQKRFDPDEFLSSFDPDNFLKQESTGFWGGVGGSFKRGALSSLQAASFGRAGISGDEAARQDIEIQQEQDLFDYLVQNTNDRRAILTQKEKLDQAREKKRRLESEQTEFISGLVEKEVEKATIPMSDGYRLFVDSEDWWAEFKKNPVEVIANITAESLAQSAPTLISTAALAPLGPGGVAAGAAGGSFVQEQASAVLEYLQEEGVDLSDRAAVQSALQNKDLMTRITQKASKKASVIAVAAGVSGGIAGRFNPFTEAVVQASLDAAGEAGGQIFATGEASGKDVFMEVIGGLPQSTVESASGYLNRRGQVGGEVEVDSSTQEDAGAAPATSTTLSNAAEVGAKKADEIAASPEPPLLNKTEAAERRVSLNITNAVSEWFADSESRARRQELSGLSMSELRERVRNLGGEVRRNDTKSDLVERVEARARGISEVATRIKLADRNAAITAEQVIPRAFYVGALKRSWAYNEFYRDVVEVSKVKVQELGAATPITEPARSPDADTPFRPSAFRRLLEEVRERRASEDPVEQGRRDFAERLAAEMQRPAPEQITQETESQVQEDPITPDDIDRSMRKPRKVLDPKRRQGLNSQAGFVSVPESVFSAMDAGFEFFVKGARTISEWTRQMVRKFGDIFDSASLAYLWNKVRERWGTENKGIGIQDSIPPSESPNSGYQIASPVLRDRVQRKIQDRFVDLRRLIKSIEQSTGKVLPDDLQTYEVEQNYHGIVPAKLQEYEQNVVSPIAEMIGKSNVTKQDVDDFLYARHAPERNRVITAKRKGEQGDWSGRSDAWARDTMDRLRKEGKLGKLESIADKIDQLLGDALQMKLEAGLISQEQFDAFRKTYKNYVPLRETEPNDEVDSFTVGRGLSPGGKEVAAVGRYTAAENILEQVVQYGQQAIEKSEKNKVAQSLLRLAREFPDNGFFAESNIPTREVVDPNTGFVRKVPDQNYIRDGMVFSMFENGERRYVEFANNERGKAMAKAFNGIGVNTSALRWLSGVMRFLSSVRTSFSPLFIPKNFLRDAGFAGYAISVDDSIATASKVIWNIRKALPALREGIRNERQATKSQDPWVKAFFEFQENGGRMQFFNLGDIETKQKSIRRSIQQAKGGSQTEFIKVVKKSLSLVEDYNSIVENGVRLSYYKYLRDNGATTQKAANLARNLTVNFSTKGEWGSAINNLYMFYNASVQGTARFMGALATKRGMALATSITAMSLANNFMNRILGGQDDDGEDRYDKQTTFDKHNNFILMNPMSDRGGHIKIPMAYGINALWGLGQEIGDVLFGGKPVGKAAGDAALTAINAFNPLGGQNWQTTIAPTLLDPAVELSLNENFAGNPIYPEKFPWNQHTPDSQLYFSSTGEVPKWVSQKLNSLSGGNAYKAGGMDYYPDTIEHLTQFVAGGLGTFLNDMVDAGSESPRIFRKAVNGEWDNIAYEDIPFVNIFYGNKRDWVDRSKYYEIRARVTETLAAVEDARKARDPIYREMADEARWANRAKAIVEATDKRLKEIRDRKERMNLVEPTAEVLDAVEAIEAREQKIILEANQRLRALLPE